MQYTTTPWALWVAHGGSPLGVLGRVLRYLLRQRKLVALAALLSVLSQFSIVGIPKVIQRMVDMVLIEQRMDQLWVAALVVLGLAASRLALGYSELVLGVRVGQEFMRDLRQELYDNLVRLSFSFFDRTRTGQLMSRITNDLEPIGGFATFQCRMIVRSVLTFVLVLIVCLAMNWKLALLALCTMPLVTVTAATLGARVRPAYEHARELLAQVTSRLQESIAAVAIVKAYRREADETERFAGDSEKLRDANYRAEQIDALYFPLTGFWAGLAMVAVLGFGGMYVIRGELTAGEFVAFNMYVTMLVFPMRVTGWAVSGAMRAMAAAGRVFAIMDEQPDIGSPPSPRRLGRLRGDIRLEGVCFEHVPGQPVLRDIDLNIRAGETLGVLGAVGSGKSTLASLIPRFYDPTAGRVLVDGVNVREVDLEELRSQIGVVFQESFLFSGTIRENIAFGKPGATDDEVREAARKAAILDFIDSLDEGMETMVGERGMRLSGGQQQRIAIARALLTDPRILILDSCTSSVDTYTEHLIQKALAELMAGRTTVVIAHRASSLANADRVIVLDRGRIVQDGAPDELARDQNGLFARFLDLQQGLESLEVA